MITRRAIELSVAFVFATALASPFGLAAAQEKIKIRSAYIPAVTWLPAWVAQDKGFFDKHGLEVSFTVVQNIAPLPSIVGKQLDIAPATVVDLIKAASGGLNVAAVAGGHMDTAEDAPNSIVAGKNSGIKNIKDLAGKTIGSPGQGSILHVALLHWLKAEGVDPNSVRAVQVPFPNMADQLAAGRIDAAEAVQPFVDRMKEAGDLSLGDQLLHVASPVISTVWAADRTWAELNKPTIEKWTAAINEAVAYIKENPTAARQIAANYTKLPPAVVQTLVFPTFDSSVQPAKLEVWIRVLEELGQLQKKVNAADLIVTSK